MSSINHQFTFQYSQPKEYRFSHDSVFLAQYVFDWILKNPTFLIKSALDLCSGCGIVGMDLLFHLRNSADIFRCAEIQKFDFLEIQEIYQTHFEINKLKLSRLLQKEPEINFLNMNYSDLSTEPRFYKKYDLIVSNPPYFKVGHGKMSPSEFKNRCRFFLDSDFLELVKSIQFALTDQGKAFVLVKSLKDHNQVYDFKKLSDQFQMSIEKHGEVRGTNLILFSRSNFI